MTTCVGTAERTSRAWSEHNLTQSRPALVSNHMCAPLALLNHLSKKLDSRGVACQQGVNTPVRHVSVEEHQADRRVEFRANICRRRCWNFA